MEKQLVFCRRILKLHLYSKAFNLLITISLYYHLQFPKLYCEKRIDSPNYCLLYIILGCLEQRQVMTVLRFRTAVVFLKVDDMSESTISGLMIPNIVLLQFLNYLTTLSFYIKFPKMRSLSRIKIRKHEKYVLCNG